MVHCNSFLFWPMLYLYNADLCTCRCRLTECPKFRKVQSRQTRRSIMSTCKLGVAAHTSSRTGSPHKQGSVSSPIEEQLSAQHQHPAELLALRRQDGSLLLDDDTVLLEGLTRATSVTPHEAGGVVLGFSVANGAVASKDFPVGKVHPAAHSCNACSTTCCMQNSDFQWTNS